MKFLIVILFLIPLSVWAQGQNMKLNKPVRRIEESKEKEARPLTPGTLEDDDQLKVQKSIRWPVRTLNIKEVEAKVMAEEIESE